MALSKVGSTFFSFAILQVWFSGSDAFPVTNIATSGRQFTTSLSAKVLNRRRTLFEVAGVLGLPTLIESSKPSECFASDDFQVGGSPVKGSEAIMSQKAHGTTEQPVQDNLRFGASQKVADKICSFNRRFAEYATYYQRETDFEKIVRDSNGPITFYDSVTGKPLYRAPIGRSVDEFLSESAVHGWPSFRDQEVVWENVRVLRDGETVSTAGTHLGHNLPDGKGNRYCINVVSISGNPTV